MIGTTQSREYKLKGGLGDWLPPSAQFCPFHAQSLPRDDAWLFQNSEGQAEGWGKQKKSGRIL